MSRDHPKLRRDQCVGDTGADEVKLIHYDAEPAIARNVVRSPLTVPSRPSSGNALTKIGSTVSQVFT